MISSEIAGMVESPSTTAHSGPDMKCVLKMSCRKGTVQTSMSKTMDEPTAYCIHLFEKNPMRASETFSERTV